MLPKRSKGGEGEEVSQSINWKTTQFHSFVHTTYSIGRMNVRASLLPSSALTLSSALIFSWIWCASENYSEHCYGDGNQGADKEANYFPFSMLLLSHKSFQRCKRKLNDDERVLVDPPFVSRPFDVRKRILFQLVIHLCETSFVRSLSSLIAATPPNTAFSVLKSESNCVSLLIAYQRSSKTEIGQHF